MLQERWYEYDLDGQAKMLGGVFWLKDLFCCFLLFFFSAMRTVARMLGYLSL